MKKINQEFEFFKSQIENKKEEKCNVIITGQPGTGKTTLSKMIIGYLEEKEQNQMQVLYLKQSELSSIDIVLKDKKVDVIYLENISIVDQQKKKDLLEFLSLISKKVHLIMNTYDDLAIFDEVLDDRCIKIEIPFYTQDEIDGVFLELVNREKEELTDDFHEYLKKYFTYSYYEGKTISKNAVFAYEVFSSLLKQRIMLHKQVIDFNCLPSNIKKEMDDYESRDKKVLLNQILERVSTMVRNQELDQYVQSIILKNKIDQEFRQQDIAVSIEPPLLIYGNEGSGKKEFADILCQLYDALDITKSITPIYALDNMFLQQIEIAYQLKKVILIDARQIMFDIKKITTLCNYWNKGLKIIVISSFKEIESFNQQNEDFFNIFNKIELQDYSVNEKYKLFKKICNENQISISLEAAGAIQMLFTLYKKKNKGQDENYYAVRTLYEKINLHRYHRKTIPYYEIILEDVLKVLDDI